MMEGKDKVGAVMVVGSGIAGIQTSLDMADSGLKVYLLEQDSSIGGVMAQLDKTFPTNDCAMCMLAPKLVDCGRHQNIELLTFSQIVGLTGEPGRFRAVVKRLPRYVDEEKCNGCGDCFDKCPVDFPSEYDEGLAQRKAIFKRFPQANPNVAAIEKKAVSPCRYGCPAGANVHGYVALISQGRFKDALALIMDKIPFPGSLGRICHHPCEGTCNREQFDDPISIRDLKRFVADHEWENLQESMKQISEEAEEEAPKDPGGKVAVIGAGPAGLTCAQDLVLKGHEVTIFEAMPEPGGMLRYGVPRYRLPKEVLDKEVNRIFDLGVELKVNTRVGGEITFSQLRENGFDAVFIGIGTPKPKPLKLEGGDSDGVSQGLDFLRDVALEKEVKIGQKVIVIGGGNVAIDVARTAKRLGAKEVHLACLENREEMPSHSWEIEEAYEEEIEIHPSWGPNRILVENGKAAGLEMIRCTAVFDSEGRFSPTFDPEKKEVLEGDTIFITIGQACDLSLLSENDGVETPNGLLRVDPITFETSQAGVFAGGDAVSGPASAVEAIGAGHEAAISIDRYIRRGEELAEGRGLPKRETADVPDTSERVPQARKSVPLIDMGKRLSSFDEILPPFTEEEAQEEAQRCMNCGICSECFQCVEACQREALLHDQVEELVEIDVGAVVLALGFKNFDPRRKPELGYARHDNVVTAIEFERILSASGPSGGHVVRLKDHKEPKKIAWIQCVGSRDMTCNEYCSSVCCMFATKEAMIAQEHSPGLEAHIYYMDMRSYGKGFDKYYERAQEEHKIQYRRSRVSEIIEDRETKNLKILFENEAGDLLEEEYDMVVLSAGFDAPEQLKELKEVLGIDLNRFGFVETGPFSSVETTRAGILVCGAASEPKDVPETVTEASAAAAKAGGLLKEVRGTMVTDKAYPEEKDVSAQEPRIGMFVCHCGINIGGVVNVPEVVEYAKTLPSVVYAEHNMFTCSQDTQEKIREKVEEFGLNRVVVASCTPSTHEPLFRDTIHEAGLNPYLFELANIRDHCSWVHRNVPAEATEKAKDLVRVAVAKSRRLKPVHPTSISLTHKAIVLGGGLAGMTAALAVADQGFEVFLVEKEKEFGGHLRNIHYSLDGGNPQELLKDMIEKVTSHELIKTYCGYAPKEVTGYVGNYRTRIEPVEDGEAQEVEHGVVIMATGAKSHTPNEYAYGEDERVLTQSELEARLAEGGKGLENIKKAVMIQCIGSREPERPYCSRICCHKAVKNALKLLELNPGISLFVFYRDIRTYGFSEEYFRKAREKGAIFIPFDPDSKPVLNRENGNLAIEVFDPLLQRKLVINTDLLALSTGIEAGDNDELARLYKLPRTPEGFFLEAHVKLRPVDFSSDGIFLCGLAHSPRTIKETVSQALGAASRAAVLLSKEKIEAKGIIARVVERFCSGCGLCVKTCPYEARRINEETGKAEVVDVLCQGCGACATACPNSATQQKAFEKHQILSMVAAVLE